jgi:hypothetical protein
MERFMSSIAAGNKQNTIKLGNNVEKNELKLSF